MLTPNEQQQFLSRRALHLILLPTEQCNFRCAYCYEEFLLGRMPPSVVAAVKALVQRRLPELELLSIEWFGGEPLLAAELVVELQSWACALRDASPGLRLHAQMTTNGFLLKPPLLRRLLDCEVRSFQIPVDGPREMHDRQRPRANGEGSFDVIWANLLAMRELREPFHVLVRVHVTHDNLPSLRVFVHELSAAFGGDPRFSVSLRPVEQLGGPNDGELAILDEAGVAELEALEAIANREGLDVHAGPFAAEGALKGCYAAAASSYVVRSNGELAKCTVALRHPENRVGVLREDGTVELDTQKMLGWMRGVFSGDQASLACPMNGFVKLRPWRGDRAPKSALVQLGGGRRASSQPQS